MAKTKVTVSVAPELLHVLDRLVAAQSHASRSAAVEAAIEGMRRAELDARLSRALDGLDEDARAEQHALAEEGLYDYGCIVEGQPW